MPGARWFEGAELNYAEALFRRVVAGSAGARCSSRSGTRCGEVERAELDATRSRPRRPACAGSVSVAATGSWRSSRTSPRRSSRFLACASIGAIWASCSPDFGTRSLIDRFAQI